MKRLLIRRQLQLLDKVADLRIRLYRAKDFSEQVDVLIELEEVCKKIQSINTILENKFKAC